MKILVVQDTDWLRRGPHQQHHIFEQLSLRGHEVVVVDFPLVWRQHERPRPWVGPVEIPNAARLYPGAKVRVMRPGLVRLPLADKASILVTYRFFLKRLVRDWKPDVVVGHGILLDRMARKAMKGTGIPYVAHVLDALHTLLETPGLKGLARRYEQANYRAADAVVVINQALGDYVREMGASAKGVHVVPTGVDPDRFVPKRGRDRVREDLGIRPDETVLLFMGWLYPFSGILEVAGKLVTMGPAGENLRLLVVGAGDLEGPLRELRDSSPKGSRIIMTGWRPYGEMPDFLAASDFCLLPAQVNDTMKYIVPVKIYEYLAAGKPILATALPGVKREFAESAALIYLAAPETAPEEALRLAKSTASADLAEAARAAVLGNRGSVVTDRFEHVLKRMVTRPCPGGSLNPERGAAG